MMMISKGLKEKTLMLKKSPMTGPGSGYSRRIEPLKILSLTLMNMSQWIF
jgi:hypothetical protein